tara:strand:- start:2173 stop:3066 length:894 start_codon:yes stop_codon:yes gene_type:complete
LAFDITKALSLFDQKNYTYKAIDRNESNYIYKVENYKNFNKSKSIILSNELFDAIPHHLVSIKDGKIYEKYVELKNDKFVEVLDLASCNCIEKRLSKINEKITNADAEIMCKDYEIKEQFSSIISEGYVLTIDYGMTEKDLFYNGKKKSFMSVINNHNFYNDYFFAPGKSDITFQVDMKDISDDFNEIGLINQFIMSQRQFLYNLGLGECLVALSKSQMGSEKINKNRYAINQLIKPNGMGNYFVRLDATDNCNFSLEQLQIDNKLYDNIPLIEEFPQRFELPGIYKQNIIVQEEFN